MENLQRKISLYSSLNNETPPNLNLNQFYINCHAQRLKEFKMGIPYLPSMSNGNVPNPSSKSSAVTPICVHAPDTSSNAGDLNHRCSNPLCTWWCHQTMVSRSSR